MGDLNIVEKARIFATAAHGAIGQKRKYTNEDYIVHPEEVASLVALNTENPILTAAAWLHDVVEDTKVSQELILREFGEDVSELVWFLTDISKPSHGNRGQRKALDRAHISCAPAGAKTIKLADLISNTSTITQYDPNFSKVYLAEKRLLLEVLKEGNKILYETAYSLAYKG